jgi:hypothetical protein
MISSSPENQQARVDGSLRLRWLLQSEAAPLIRPRHRQVDETLQAKAAHVCTLDPFGRLLSWPQTAISLSKDIFKRGFERNRQCALQPSGKSPRLLQLLP